MFAYPCPFCSQRLLAAPERAGNRTICPKCLKPIVIPKPSEDSPAPPPIETSDSDDQFPNDEVPISLMPAVDDGYLTPPPAAEVPSMPLDRPLARIGIPAGTNADPIPLQPQAAALFHNQESLHEMFPPPLDVDSGTYPQPPMPPVEELLPPVTNAPTPPPRAGLVHHKTPPKAEPTPLTDSSSNPSLPEVQLPKQPTPYPPQPAFQPLPTPKPQASPIPSEKAHTGHTPAVHSHTVHTPTAHTYTAPATPVAHAGVPHQPAGFATNGYPAPGRITGDHPHAENQPTLNGQPNGVVTFNPTQVEAMDIAAELSQALRMKMPPPQEPPSDLRLSTGLWIVLMSCGLGLWAFCMLTASTELLKYVAVIGGILFVLGYVWVTVAHGKRKFINGLLALLPPVWLVRAANMPTEPGYRPLRFVVGGTMLLVLYLVGPYLQPMLYSVAGIEKETNELPPEVRYESYQTKLQEAERENNSQRLKDLLADFTKLSTMGDPKLAQERAGLIPILRRLTKNARGETRADALSTLVLLAANESKAELIAAIKSDNEDERKAAYRLAPKLPDAEVAQALATRVGADDQQELLADAIRGMRQFAESPLLPLLKSKDGTIRLTAQLLLQELGGPKSLEMLPKMIAEAATPKERQGLEALLIQIRAQQPIPKTP